MNEYRRQPPLCPSRKDATEIVHPVHNGDPDARRQRPGPRLDHRELDFSVRPDADDVAPLEGGRKREATPAIRLAFRGPRSLARIALPLAGGHGFFPLKQSRSGVEPECRSWRWQRRAIQGAPPEGGCPPWTPSARCRVPAHLELRNPGWRNTPARSRPALLILGLTAMARGGFRGGRFSRGR